MAGKMPAVYTRSPTGGGSSMPASPLSLDEREKIYYGLVRGATVTSIAVGIRRHRCTVSAEISRNGGRDDYRPFRAHRRAAECRKRPKFRLFEQFPKLAAHVACRLEAKDSPMTIAVEIANGLYPEIAATVSHETIYQEIYDHRRTTLPRETFRCLHRRRRLRVTRRSRRPKQRWRDTMRSISQRPGVAGTRSEVGHFEGDLIIGQGHRSAIATVFDRKSRHLWMASLPNGHNADLTLAALSQLFERIPPALRRTLTWDQGSEMAHHDELANRCNIDVYFADAHSPWQRPTNENGNGLIRRYVGKGTDLADFTAVDLRSIEHRINTMPRRVLNWDTAEHVYHQAVAMTD
jgi:IS30 family transposase